MRKLKPAAFVRSFKQMVENLRETTVSKDRLDKEITERKRPKKALKESHNQLERRVLERTKELGEANAALGAEISQRKQAEDALLESEGQSRSSWPNWSFFTERLPWACATWTRICVIGGATKNSLRSMASPSLTTSGEHFEKLSPKLRRRWSLYITI